jgi:hypothetical protein
MILNPDRFTSPMTLFGHPSILSAFLRKNAVEKPKKSVKGVYNRVEDSPIKL